MAGLTPTNGPLGTDAYKLFHKDGYHSAIVGIYSNYTSRFGKYSNVADNEGVIALGLQYFIQKKLVEEWGTFFSARKDKAVARFKRFIDPFLGLDYDCSHLEALHDLGYLPLEIKAVPEGTMVPYGVAAITIENTVKGFQWLPNYLETSMSSNGWPMQTSATTSFHYIKAAKAMLERTGTGLDMLPFLIHDFSYRGMFGDQAAQMSAFSHIAMGNYGTDTLPVLEFAEDYYGADIMNEFVACSVPATEHSTATSYIMAYAEEHGVTKLQAEVEYVRYLFTKVPDNAIVSHVSDSYDFWLFVEFGLPQLKDEILSREGKLVIRPDSGDPTDILCGTSPYHLPNNGGSAQEKGLLVMLVELFGCTPTSEGFGLVNPKIGAIYGDAITLERQADIYRRCEEKFLVPMIVLGVGSYSFQMVTRDTHGSAVKATNATLEVQTAPPEDDYEFDLPICKDPKTDPTKKSATGLLRVERENGKLVQYDRQTRDQAAGGLLEVVYKDGELIRKTTLAEIRAVVAAQL